jgi:hypothetical protein
MMFVLSPGFTPELVDAFVLELPVLLGLGYFFAGRTGFEVVFALNAIALGAIKLYTDWPDLGDDLVALGAIAGGAGWLVLAALGRGRVLRPAFLGALPLGAFAIAVGVWKAAHDFYDPLDLLLADAAFVSGVALAVYALRTRLRFLRRGL